MATNRSRRDFEYELLATGVFDADRYFNVYIGYAKERLADIRGRARSPGVACVNTH